MDIFFTCDLFTPFKGGGEKVGKIFKILLIFLIFVCYKDIFAKELILFPVSPMERIIDNKTIPESEAMERASVDGIRVFGSPGQYVPASFVIYSTLEKVENITIDIGDLVSTDSKKKILSSNIDDYIVKCWYAPVCEMWGTVRKYEYLPELLLKDDSLIEVDHSTGTNKPAFESELPVISERIKPFCLNRRFMKQIWLIIHISDNSQPGTYNGYIKVKTGNLSESIKLQLDVLNIKLADPLADLGVFFPESLLKFSMDYYRMMLRNMAVHGVNFAYIITPLIDEKKFEAGDFSELKKYIDIWKEEGILTKRAVLPDTYLTQMIWASIGKKELAEDFLERARTYSRRLYKFLKTNYPEVDWYVYGVDEKTGDSRIQKIFHEEGLKVFNASNTPEEYLHYNLFFTYVWFPHRGVQSLIRFARARNHSVGYYTPMTQFKESVLFRYRVGFNLWNIRGEGYVPWVYLESADATAWKKPEIGKHHFGFVFPAKNGVINTLQWEGYREGVYDFRYISTLALVVEKAEQLKIKDPLLEKAANFCKIVYIQPYNETGKIQYFNPDRQDYMSFSTVFPWKNLEQARKEVADLIVQIQKKYPELSVEKLSHDKVLINKTYERWIKSFDVELLASATTLREDKITAFKKEYEAKNFDKALELAKEIKEMYIRNKNQWEQIGFTWELPEEVEEVLKKFKK